MLSRPYRKLTAEEYYSTNADIGYKLLLRKRLSNIHKLYWSSFYFKLFSFDEQLQECNNANKIHSVEPNCVYFRQGWH